MKGVHKLADSEDSKVAKPCYHYGKLSHLLWKYLFRDAKCFNCGRKGLAHNVCHSGCCNGKGEQEGASHTGVGIRNGSSPGRKLRGVQAVKLQAMKIKSLEAPLQIEG